MTEPSDILKRAEPFMSQCGPCDFGLVEMGCACPDGDFRPIIADLCREVERLRAELDRAEAGVRAEAAAHLRKIADCRREYLKPGMPEDQLEAISTQVFDLDIAADIVTGDLQPLYGLLPSWRWTDEMIEHLNATERTTPEPA